MSMQLDDWDAFLKDCDRSLDDLKKAATKAARAKDTRAGKRDLKRIERDLKVVGEWKAEAAEKRAEVAHWYELAKTAPPAATFQEYPIPNVNTLGSGDWAALERSGDMNKRDAQTVALNCLEADESASDDDHQHTAKIVEKLDRESALYIAGTSNPVYARAFSKIMADPAYGARRLTGEEAEAMHFVERALGSAATGIPGYAVPYASDPTVTITNANSGANPIRDISRVETISVHEFRAITSDGVTAGFAAEASESGDDTPTLAEIAITPERIDAFVPVSLELFDDWAGRPGVALQEISKLFVDAFDRVESEKFYKGAGTGSSEPLGIHTAADANTNCEVAVTTAETFGLDDVYLVASSLPERAWANATWLMNRGTGYSIRRFGEGITGQSPYWVDGIGDDNGSLLLGQPVRYSEWADDSQDIDASATETNDIIIVGDFGNQYVIVDRVGMFVDVIQHLVGGNQRPTGQRGVVAYKRTSAEPLNVVNSFRVLQAPTTA